MQGGWGGDTHGCFSFGVWYGLFKIDVGKSHKCESERIHLLLAFRVCDVMAHYTIKTNLSCHETNLSLDRIVETVRHVGQDYIYVMGQEFLLFIGKEQTDKAVTWGGQIPSKTKILLHKY